MYKPFLALIVGTLLCPIALKAQNAVPPQDADTKLFTYKEVVLVEGNKSDLFNRAIAWVNKQYKNPTEATKVRDPQTGVIDILHRIEVYNNDKGSRLLAGVVDYSLKIELKDGRYRYIITNLTLRQSSRFPIEKWLDKTDKQYQPAWDSYLAQVDENCRKIIASLKQEMLPPVPKKVDEW